MKRVTFIVNENNVIGGVNTVVNTLASDMISKNYNVGVIGITKQRHQKFEFDEEISVETICSIPITLESDLSALISSKHSFSKYYRLFKFAGSLLLLSALKKKHKRLLSKLIDKSDVIICTQLAAFSYLKKESYCKTIISLHSSYENLMNSSYNRKLMKRIQQEQLKLILLSSNDSLKAKKNGFNSDYIYNPVKKMKFIHTSMNNRLFFYGRFSEEKNLLQMLDIVELFLFKYPEFKFEMYGDGQLKHQIIEKVSTMSCVNSRIHVRPFERNVEMILNGGGILLLTSHNEGLPMTIIESANYGIPTIAFDTFSSVCELIVDNYTGMIVTAYDIDQYLLKLDEIVKWNRDELDLRLKLHAKNFSIDNIMDKWSNEIEGIIR